MAQVSLAKVVTTLHLTRKGLASILNLGGTAFEAAPFRFGTMGPPVGSILGDRLLLVTDVPYTPLHMLEGTCKGMHGKAVASLLVIKLETMEDEDVRNTTDVGRTTVLLFVRMGVGPLATTMDAINAAQDQRIKVSIIRLGERICPRS